MKRLAADIIHFFKDQGFAIVSTIDTKGRPHSACKGIVDIQKSGRVFLLDLYLGETLKNLQRNPSLSITSVEEHRFKGYCLKGKAKILDGSDLSAKIIKAWDSKISSRLTKRLIKNIQQESSRRHHPEAMLPHPKYMIIAEIDEVVDLTPQQLQ